MSELKYKEGDKVLIKSIDWYNKYKDEDGDVLCGEFVFLKDMKKFCSETLTISADVDDGYLMFEDDHGYVWTDEMFEKLVERNGKTYPYKVGDRVVLKGNNRCATITDLKYNSWGNLSYYVKIDNDKDISIDYPTDLLLPYDNMIECKVGEEMKSEDELLDEYEELTDRAFKGGYEKCKSDIELNGFQLPDGYIFKDGNGNVINTNKIVLEKKKQYPKTYKECCKILNYQPDEYDEDEILIYGFMSDELRSLQKLLVCRNAYWKLYGDEMGLDKPWEPSKDKMVYSFYRHSNEIETDIFSGESVTFEFPTEEMRDFFKENFDTDIEICKEFL